MLPVKRMHLGLSTLTIYLLVCIFLQTLLTCEANPAPAPAACNSTNSTARNFQLCTDFRDLRDVIPANTLAYLTTKHYRKDASFRKAMNFMRTDQFASVSQQISQSDVYQSLLKQFSDAGVYTETIASIASIMSCLLLPEPRYGDDYQNQVPTFIASRSLRTFALEVMNAIPREQFSSELNTKLDDSEQFKKFYQIAASSAFQESVFNGFKSYQLKYPLSVLKRNGIDLRKLVSIIFQVLSWGPSV